MTIKDFCPNNSIETFSSFPIGAVTPLVRTTSSVVSCFFSSLFEPFLPFTSKNHAPSISLQSFNRDNINIIPALSNFRNALEGYHPLKIKKILIEFTRQYEQYQNDATSLKEKHKKALKKFESIRNDVLKKDFSKQKEKEIDASFEKFFSLFKTFDSPELHATKSSRLCQQLDQAIQYSKDKKINCLQALKDVKKEFNYEQNKNDVTIYENTLKKFKEICKDALKTEFQDQKNADIKDFFEKSLLDPWQTASNLLDECNSIVMGSQQLYIELDKVIQYIETKNILAKEFLEPLQKLKDQFASKNTSQGHNKQITTHRKLFDSVAEASALIELLVSEKPASDHLLKNTQKILLEEIKKMLSLIKKDAADHQEMRFTDANFLTPLKNKLQNLPKDNPSLFTKKEKTILDKLQKDLYAISYGKTFNKKDLQEKLHQCYDIIKEALPNTLFTQTTDTLRNLEQYTTKDKISPEDHKKIIDKLHVLRAFINNPRMFPSNEITLEELKDKFLAVDSAKAIADLNSLINTHRLYSPNERAFKELKNAHPSMQKELDRLYPLKKMAFKKLKDRIIFNQKILSCLDSFIHNPHIQANEKTKIENLKEKLSAIAPDQEVFILLNSFINNPKIPCKANKQALDALQEKIPANVLNSLYPLEKTAFEDLQKNLSSIIPDQEIIDLLDAFINNSNIPFQNEEKKLFVEVKKNLSSIDKMVLDCLYPLEKSLFEDIKKNLSSLQQESIDLLNSFSSPPFVVNKNAMEKLREALSSVSVQETLELLDSLISDPSMTNEKKQLFENAKKSISSIKKEFTCFDSITQEELRKELVSIIPDQALRDLTVIINDSSITGVEKQTFKDVKSHLSSIKLSARTYLRSIEKTHVKNAKESLSSINAKVINSLNSLMNDPRLPPNQKTAFNELKKNLLSLKQGAVAYSHSLEKATFENLEKSLSATMPNQNLSQEEVASFQAKFQKCHMLIKEMEIRIPIKERNKLVIEQEMQKLAKHATNLSFMMFLDKTLFTSTRDSLFYRNIIQRAEETSGCPKEILLAELQNEGASGWKIMAAKIYFFVTKHLGIENSVFTMISRTMANYSTLIYQSLDQEYDQDQFRSLIQGIIKNTTIYFQLLSSAMSNAKEDAQTQPEQLTALIIKQLLLLKPQENEAMLKDLDIKDLYNKLVDDFVEKSESGLLRWIAPWLNNYKHKLVSSVIEIGTDSLLNPAPNGNASTANILLRDGLKTLYKKWPAIANEGIKPIIIDEDLHIFPTDKELPLLTIQEKSKHSEMKKMTQSFVENLMAVLNEYKSIQQIANITKIIIANEKHLKDLKAQSLPLEGIINPQIEKIEKWNYETRLKLDLLINPALQGPARPSLPLYPVIKYWTHQAEKILPRAEEEKQSVVLPVGEIVNDKIDNAIRPIVDNVIAEKVTLILTKLLEQPLSEDLIYDAFCQGLLSTNLAIARPKENKETQGAVEQEIKELIRDDSFAIASSILPILIKDYTRVERLSKLAEKISFVPERISPIIEERFQNIVGITRQKAFFQPKAVLQLGRKVILPV